jgi:succinyl-CoA synthetase beta subunit
LLGAVGPIAPPLAWDNGIVAQSDLFPWLAQFGLPVTPVFKATNASEAKAAIEQLGGPAVMKIDTSRVVHKSDIGGVTLGVTVATAMNDYEKLHAVLTPPIGSLPGESVVVAPFVSGGIEFYVGAKREPSFGPVVVLGLGGRLLEIMERTALLIAPFNKRQVLDAIVESGATKMLSGFRAGPKANLDGLAELVVKVGDIALALGERLDVLDLNPIIVTAARPAGVVVDARLVLKSVAP